MATDGSRLLVPQERSLYGATSIDDAAASVEASMVSAAGRRDYGIRNLLLLFSLVINITTNVMGAFLPLEAVNLDISIQSVGVLFAASPLSTALLSPLAGWACGRFGSSPVLLASVLIVVAVNFGLACLPIIAQSPFACFCVLVVARTGIGVGSAMGSSAVLTCLAMFHPDAMGAMNGQVETSIGIGFAVGTALGGFLYGAGGWSLPFVFAAVVQLICGVSIWIFLAKALQAAQVAEYPKKEEPAPEISQQSWRHLCTFGYSLPTIAVLLLAVAFTVPAPVLPVYWAEMGLSVEAISILQAAMATAYAICSMGWGHISDRTRPDVLIAVGLLMAGLTYGFISSPSPVLSGATFVLWGVLGSCVTVPAIPALLKAVEEGGPEVVGLAIGVEETMYFCGEVIGPMLGSWGQPRYGIQGMLWNLALLMLGYAACYIAYLLYQLLQMHLDRKV